MLRESTHRSGHGERSHAFRALFIMLLLLSFVTMASAAAKPGLLKSPRTSASSFGRTGRHSSTWATPRGNCSIVSIAKKQTSTSKAALRRASP